MPSLLHKLRYFKYRYDYTRAPKLKHIKPIDICLELSSSCNMNCSYCYHSDQKNLPFEKGLMDKNLAFMIIADAANVGVNSIKFNYRGEATLHPFYRDITGLAKDLSGKGAFLERITNSNFKILPTRREHVFEGLANLTKVKVSYDSFRKDVFEKQRAGGDHDLTTQNIDLFYNYKLRLKTNTEIVIQAVRTKLNQNEDLESLIKKRWPSATVSVRDMVAGRVEKDLSEFENKKRDVNNRQSCIQAHARMIVHHNGKVSPCCPSIKNDLIIGDMNEQSVIQVFNSLEAKRLRVSLLNKSAFELEPCKSCSSFESYAGYIPPWNS